MLRRITQAAEEGRSFVGVFPVGPVGQYPRLAQKVKDAGTWLEHDQKRYWRGQERKRAEMLSQAKLALMEKRTQKTPLGGRYSCVEEEKAFKIAKRRHEEAEHKTASVQRWIRQFEHDTELYRGALQSLTQSVDSDLPAAVACLDRMIDALEA